MLRTLLALMLAAAPAAFAADPPPQAVPSTEIPPRDSGAGATGSPVRPLNQQIMRTVPTASEERQAAIAAFRPAYAAAKSPRLLVLFNRDMEDNDDRTMTKVMKTEAGVSGTTPSGGSFRQQGGASVSVATGPDPNAYAGTDLDALQQAFERPFVEAGARLVDRDTAVRVHGLSEDAVFSYVDLPETQRAQVAGVKKYADILVTVQADYGTATVRKVSGPKTVSAPYLIVRAVRLSDARILATATTQDVRVADTDAETASRVALELMDRLAAAW